jgi:hypothetical protein
MLAGILRRMLLLYQKKNKMTANLWTNDNFQDNTIILVKQVR